MHHGATITVVYTTTSSYASCYIVLTALIKLQEDIVPKNILMIGPTGCGKTEIARRLAKLADAPFVKVEATKYTEVGFHGRDVDQIIRDLLDNAIVMVKQRMRTQLRDQVAASVEQRIVEALTGNDDEREASNFRDLYKQGQLDATEVELDLPVSRGRAVGILPIPVDNPQIEMAFGKLTSMFESHMGGRGERRTEKRKMTVAEARKILEDSEVEAIMSQETVVREAISAVEQDGIVFIDEIDKIVTSSGYRYGAFDYVDCIVLTMRC